MWKPNYFMSLPQSKRFYSSGSIRHYRNFASRGFVDAVRGRDPISWQEMNLGVDCYSNQIDITNAIFDPLADNVNIIGCRGSGKSVGATNALAALLSTTPNQHWISTAPILPQASRLIRFTRAAMEKNKVTRDLLDIGSSSALRLHWKNGNTFIGVSGQMRANSEGDHGNGIIMDEAHLVPGLSVSSKLRPMLSGINVATKMVKLGVAMGRGHFFRTFNAPGARNCICRWRDCEIHKLEPAPHLFYKGEQISRKLWLQMPMEYRRRYFPDRPDLCPSFPTGSESSIIDWQTQFELDWVEDIMNFLSEAQHKTLGSGEHPPLRKGRMGERYFGGLDTARGSSVGARDADFTALAIWRLNRDGSVDKVASFRWQGSPNDQEQEIWDICNPRNGQFRLEFLFCDRGDVAALMIDQFRKAGMPVHGVDMGAKATLADSPKNWKNTLFDSFEIHLQNGMAHYPSMDSLRPLTEGSPEDKVQAENFQTDFFEWGVIQRIRDTNGRGLNDKIQAPQERVEDEDGSGSTVMVHDDSCQADVLAVWAATNPIRIQKLLASKGSLEGYQIPLPVFGPATTSNFTGQSGGGGGENPLAIHEQRMAANNATPGGAPQDQGWTPGSGAAAMPASLSDYLGVNRIDKKRNGLL